MAGIDPYTGEPIPDDAGTTLNQSGPTASRPFSMNSGFGAAPAAPMRGPQPQFPWGGGAKPAAPMRGAYPNFPPLGPGSDTGQSPQYTGPPSGNGFATGAGAPTQPGGPAPFHLPQWGPWHAGGSPTGPIINPPSSPVPSSQSQGGGIGSDANFPLNNSNAAPSPTDNGPSAWDNLTGLGSRIKNWMGTPNLNIPDAALSAAPGDTGGYVPPGPPQGGGPSPSGSGGIGSDANFPLIGGAQAPGGMPWAGNNAGQPYGAGAPGGMPWAGNNAGQPYGQGATAGRAPAQVNMGHGAPGVVAPHPAVQAAAARAAAGQPSSPFTMVLRPNAPASNQSGRGGGGTPLATALDLSGWRPQAAAPQAAPARRAPVQGPLAKTALKRPAAPAPYPVTESGSPTPLSAQHGGVGQPTTPAGYGDQSWLYGNQPPF